MSVSWQLQSTYSVSGAVIPIYVSVGSVGGEGAGSCDLGGGTAPGSLGLLVLLLLPEFSWRKHAMPNRRRSCACRCLAVDSPECSWWEFMAATSKQLRWQPLEEVVGKEAERQMHAGHLVHRRWQLLLQQMSLLSVHVGHGYPCTRCHLRFLLQISATNCP